MLSLHGRIKWCVPDHSMIFIPGRSLIRPSEGLFRYGLVGIEGENYKCVPSKRLHRNDFKNYMAYFDDSNEGILIAGIILGGL